MILKHKVKCASFHLRVCGSIVDFMSRRNATGFCEKGSKKANILSELELVFLNAKYGDELVFDINCKDEVADEIKEFVEGL